MIDVDRLQDAIEAALSPEIRAQRLGAAGHGGSLAESTPPAGTPLTEPVASTRLPHSLDVRVPTLAGPSTEASPFRAVDAEEREWIQRYHRVLHRGTDEERLEVLDHCRQRAYRDGDALWRSMLVLLSARMGRTAEATLDLDLAGREADVVGLGPEGLDLVTNLAEAAAVLGDRAWAAAALSSLSGLDGGLVVMMRDGTLKGALARYRALAALTCGRLDRADSDFAVAAEVNRAQNHRVALAHTLLEWSQALATIDPDRSHLLQREGMNVAAEVGLSLGGGPTSDGLGIRTEPDPVPVPVEPAPTDPELSSTAYWQPPPIRSTRPGWTTG